MLEYLNVQLFTEDVNHISVQFLKGRGGCCWVSHDPQIANICLHSSSDCTVSHKL